MNSWKIPTPNQLQAPQYKFGGTVANGRSHIHAQILYKFGGKLADGRGRKNLPNTILVA